MKWVLLSATAICGLAAIGLGLAAAPSNDAFPGQVIEKLPFETRVPLAEATTQPGEPLGPFEGHTVWYSYTEMETRPAVPHSLVFDLSGSDSPTFIHIYRGDTLGSLKPISSGYTGGNGPWSAIVPLRLFETYRVQVGALGPASAGSASLRITTCFAPFNDGFPGFYIPAFPHDEEVNTTCATIERGDATAFGATVWWHGTAPAAGYLVADVSGSDYASRVHLKNEAGLPIPGGMLDLWECPQQAVLTVSANERFWVVAGGNGYPGETGALRLHVTFSEAPPAQPCPARTPPPALTASPPTGGGGGGTPAPGPPASGSGSRDAGRGSGIITPAAAVTAGIVLLTAAGFFASRRPRP